MHAGKSNKGHVALTKQFVLCRWTLVTCRKQLSRKKNRASCLLRWNITMNFNSLETPVYSVRTASSCVLKHIRKVNQEIRGLLKPGGNKRTIWFTCGVLQHHIHNTYVHTQHCMVEYASSAAMHYRNDIFLSQWKFWETFKEWTVQHYYSENLDEHAVSTMSKLCAAVLYYHNQWQIWELSAQSQCCASCSLTSRHGRPLNDDETPLCMLPVVLYLQKCDIWIQQNDNVALLSCMHTM